MIKKRGMFFSTDALLALTIFTFFILLAYPIYSEYKKETVLQSDILTILSTLKIGETNNSYVQTLLAAGDISDLNKTLLEQLGEFSVNNFSKATLLASSLFESLDSSENFGLWYDSELVYSRNSSPYEGAENIFVSRQLISGVKQGESVEAYSAIARLVSSEKVDYFYFGGYVGDGNITALVNYSGNISSAEVELVINNNFSIYINGNLVGNYSGSSQNQSPVTYSLPLDNFNSGANNISFKSNNSLYISGGFVKISYFSDAVFAQSKKKNLPGVEGIVNVYDGIYIPGNLESMEIYLHFNSSDELFFNIGNVTVFNGSGIVSQTLSNDTISSLVSYSSIKNKTVPIRIGLASSDYAIRKNLYVMSVVDLSGGVSSARAAGCGNDGVCAVKKANQLLLSSLLSLNNTYLGISAVHQGAVSPEYSHNLSRNSTSLNNTINSWDNQGNLDLCAGLNNASANLNAASSSDDIKTIILLGTKFPNSCTGGTTTVYNDTYNLACQLWTNYSIKINTIGVIGNGDSNLNDLLYNISLCANGTYNNASDGSNDLVALYNSSLQNLLNLTYSLQTTTSSNSNLHTTLYLDSYINLIYTSEDYSGETILTLEKSFSNSTQGFFNIPENSSLLEANFISYSGPLWTAKALSNGDLFFNLSSYGSNFVNLGDPFVFRLPNETLSFNNTVDMALASGASNFSVGSIHNKMIYKISKEVSSFTPLLATLEGCSWSVELSTGPYSNFKVPLNYSGSNICYYSSLNVTYNPNDAYQVAVFDLLSEIDFDADGRADIDLNSNYLSVSPEVITGIPFTWKTEAEVRSWY